MTKYENPVLNAKAGETVKKTDGRIAEIVTTMKIVIVKVEGELEINASLQNIPKKWNADDKRQEQLMKLWEEIHKIFR